MLTKRRPSTTRRGSDVSSEISASAASVFRETISENLRSALTLRWEEIPDWMRDNEYIKSGYRNVQNSWKGCLHSLFSYWHNESVNVHSHLWPALAFLSLLFYYRNEISQYSTVTWQDHSGFIIFLAAATFCLACSATYHLSTCHSERMSDFCGALDYCGIIVLIVGSFVPCLYYGFYCEKLFQIVYVAGIIFGGIATAVVVLSPDFNTPAYRGARAAAFVSLGLFGVFPVGHAIISRGWETLDNELGFSWLLLSAAFYLTGALIYAKRIPERWFPGKFDYYFASHQIFHIHVVLGAFAHYICLLKAFHHWHGIRGGTVTRRFTSCSHG